MTTEIFIRPDFEGSARAGRRQTGGDELNLGCVCNGTKRGCSLLLPYRVTDHDVAMSTVAHDDILGTMIFGVIARLSKHAVQ